MLIRVLPPLPSPNILFTLSLPDPTHDAKVDCPQAWRTQAMMVEELQEEGFGVEAPRDIYAMDKAAWHTALITEVVFDIPSRTASCTFVDGSQVTWSLAPKGDEDDGSCLDALAAVVEDVRVSSSEMDRERARQHPDMHQETPSPTSSAFSTRSTASAPPSPSKHHKRQKSLFSSLVAAVKGALSDGNSSRHPTLPLSLPPIKIPSGSSHCRTGSTFSRTQQSPPTSPVADRPPVPVFQLRVRPRADIPIPEHSKVRTYSERLRHRARSRLVDVVRRYVFPMFSTTGSPSFAETECAPELLAQVYGYPAGLYPAWILRSVLRKAEERMRDMIIEANAHGFGPAVGHAMKTLSQPSAQLREAEDDEDDASASTSVSTASESTETDGSSVHTPTDSPIRSIFSPAIVTPPGGAPRLSSLDTKALPQVPRSPSPPSSTFDFDMSTYHTLSTMRSRLLHILARMDSSPRQISSGSRYSSDLTILEIKSRRRGWSCRDYVGGARMHLVGLATPVYSSPLARCEPVTAETVARLRNQAASTLTPSPSVIGLADLSEEFGVKLSMRAVTKEMDAQLFPVCEEEEEDEMIEDANASFYQTSSRGFSLDDDFSDDESWREVRDFDLESGLLAFPRPTSPEKSAPTPTYAHLHPMTRTRTRSMRQEPHSRLPSNALLCQPLNVKVPVPVMLNHGDSLDVDVERGLGGEFTLSMDLPPPPRGWLHEDAEVACR
ncbi:hypothetical protein GSI_08968 [Ganoderma sinense ZZ0214-1]|uniref:Uncharacterized protein n=1 Tax=Ganoderma sinense ZZ0214-1 TaxID=1077348 RepID=A0A2G8S588_9APHY|nr:hypothetical protein GSI_08968 [Ganoderma sinense ZZ0214-1]